MKKTLFFLILCGFAGIVPAQQPRQNADGERQRDLAAIRSVADAVFNTPVFYFQGVPSGKVYASWRDIPAGENVTYASIYADWHYANGVIDQGMLALGRYLNEAKYTDFVADHVRFIFDNLDYFEKNRTAERMPTSYPFARMMNMTNLDNCGSMGSIVIEEQMLRPDPACRAYIDKAADYILNRQMKLDDGTLCRPGRAPAGATVWGDDMYMSVSFLAKMGRLTGEAKYFDFAALQVINMTDYLWDPVTGLNFHCYYTDLKRPGVARWGRANGWMALSNAMLIDQMPADHPRRAELIAILERQIVGFSRYQAQSGMWHQLLDKPDSYEESSVTAMFSYAVAKAVNEGWIPAMYRGIAQSGWRALRDTQIENGQFRNVCIGTGISDDLTFYYNRPVGDNEKHGVGLVMLLGVEMLRMQDAASR